MPYWSCELSSIAQIMKSDIEYISQILTVEFVHLINRQIIKCHEGTQNDKTNQKRWSSRCNCAIQAYQAFLNFINVDSQKFDGEVVQAAIKGIKSNILQVAEYREIIPMLIRTFNSNYRVMFLKFKESRK